MKKGPLATVINFCTSEKRFIQSVIEQARIFSDQIIVTHCDHFFDGIPEDEVTLNMIHRSFPNVTFVQFPYFNKYRLSKAFNSLTRRVGVSQLRDDIKTILFLDADEVIEGTHFKEWLDKSDIESLSFINFAAYWYFREPGFLSTTLEEAGTLFDRDSLTLDILIHESDRSALYESCAPEQRLRNIFGLDGRPLVHHFSWVRTKEEMLRKVRSWGHAADRDWATLVEAEFARDFTGTDFVHGYNFIKADPPFDIKMTEPIFSSRYTPNLKVVSGNELTDLISNYQR